MQSAFSRSTAARKAVVLLVTFSSAACIFFAASSSAFADFLFASAIALSASRRSCSEDLLQPAANARTLATPNAAHLYGFALILQCLLRFSPPAHAACLPTACRVELDGTEASRVRSRETLAVGLVCTPRGLWRFGEQRSAVCV